MEENNNEEIIIPVDLEKNPALNYQQYKGIVERLEEFAKVDQRKRPVSILINDFITDLKNYFNEDYVKKVGILIKGLSSKTIKQLIDYMKEKKREYQQKEKQAELEEMEANWRQIEEAINKAAEEGKQGTKKEIVERLIADIDSGTFEYEFKGKEEKKFVLKNLKGIVNAINKKEEAEAETKRKQEEAEKKRQQEEAEAEAKRKQEETEKRRQEVEAERKRQEEIKRNNMKKTKAKDDATKAMEQIEGIAKKHKVEDMTKFLSSIKDSITGKTKGINLGIKMEKIAENYLLKMIDNRMEEEKYFEQVKNFTNNFQFLREYPEIVKARHGASKINKFTDSESYERYSCLRELLQKQYNEYTGIQLLLEGKKVSDMDKKILLARKAVMDKEIEIKRKSGEIR